MAEYVELELKEIREILESGDFNSLIGRCENQYFEAKQSKPYLIDDLNEDTKKKACIEMSKDIAAMANSGEGYIVLGLDAPRSSETSRDTVTSINIFTKDQLFETQSIKGRLKNFIYPVPEIEISWFPDKNDPTKGIGYIHVLSTNEAKRYFMTQINYTDLIGFNYNYIGVPVRDGYDTHWLDVKDLYGKTKLRPESFQIAHSEIMEKFDKFEEQLININTNSGTKKKGPFEELEEIIEEVINEQQ